MTAPKLPQVAACFLVNFDTTQGYRLAWSRADNNLDLTGVDYKGLPSGLHESENDTIFILHKQNSTLYYGVCKFFQNLADFDASDHVDRGDVKMYALGVLCTPSALGARRGRASQFANNGWEFIDLLDSTLRQWVTREDVHDFGAFDALYEQLVATAAPVAKRVVENHPLSSLPLFLRTLGPLCFCLYKQALLRKRILFLQQHHDSVTNFDLGAFTYVLSLISIVPEDLNLPRLTNQRAAAAADKNSSVPLYSVGLQDLERGQLGAAGTVCSSNDSILMYQRNVCDYVVLLPGGDIEVPRIVASASLTLGPGSSLAEGLRATLKDYYKFKIVYKSYFNRTHHCQGRSLAQHHYLGSHADDASSIRTKSSTFSSFGSHFIKLQTLADLNEQGMEPHWWLDSATTAISWREFVWSAFSWFASAGTVSEAPVEGASVGFNSAALASTPSEDPLQKGTGALDDTLRHKFVEMVNIVGNFHNLTKKWFYLINEIVLEELEYERDTNASAAAAAAKIKVQLTYQDVADMELDPYSHEDLQFVKEFVLLYWGDSVSAVDIGLGLSGICC